LVLQCDCSSTVSLPDAYGGKVERKRTTTEDVANLASVSRQTVSRVLNDRNLVAEETRAPRDVAVVGFDDIPSAPHFYPPLTTIHHPLYELGRTSVRLLVDLIDGQSAPSAPIRLDTELVIRRSCSAQNTSVPAQ
jgi:DNA-binding LacI/PurR family transcriptional regulator